MASGEILGGRRGARRELLEGGLGVHAGGGLHGEGLRQGAGEGRSGAQEAAGKSRGHPTAWRGPRRPHLQGAQLLRAGGARGVGEHAEDADVRPALEPDGRARVEPAGGGEEPLALMFSNRRRGRARAAAKARLAR